MTSRTPGNDVIEGLGIQQAGQTGAELSQDLGAVRLGIVFLHSGKVVPSQ